MHETSKTVALWSDYERSLCQGHGIDIGCGPDPLPWATMRFDLPDGDANHITKHIHDSFDFVYSAHCLEHMHDPTQCLKEWFSLVRPGGHMIIIVPDEDLYEQGVWPSRFNPDHKHTFTISKRTSWSPVSINCLDLIGSLGSASELISAQLQDCFFDRSIVRHGLLRPRLSARVIGKLTQLRLIPCHVGHRLFQSMAGTIDQTTSKALAQIQFIVRKK